MPLPVAPPIATMIHEATLTFHFFVQISLVRKSQHCVHDQLEFRDRNNSNKSYHFKNFCHLDLVKSFGEERKVLIKNSKLLGNATEFEPR